MQPFGALPTSPSSPEGVVSVLSPNVDGSTATLTLSSPGPADSSAKPSAEGPIPAAAAVPAGHGTYSPAVPRRRAALTGSQQIVGNSEQVAAATGRTEGFAHTERTANTTQAAHTEQPVRPAQPESIAKTHTAQHRLDQVAAVAGPAANVHRPTASADEVSAFNAAVAARDIIKNPAETRQGRRSTKLPEVGTGSSPMSCPIPVVPLAPAPKATMQRLSPRPGGGTSRLSVPTVRRTPKAPEPPAQRQNLLAPQSAAPAPPAVVPAPAPSLQPVAGFEVWDEPTDATAPHALPTFGSHPDDQSSRIVVTELTSPATHTASTGSRHAAVQTPAPTPEKTHAGTPAPQAAVVDENNPAAFTATSTPLVPGQSGSTSGRRVLPAAQTGDVPMTAMGLNAPTAAPRREILRRENAQRAAAPPIAAVPLVIEPATAVPGAVAPVGEAHSHQLEPSADSKSPTAAAFACPHQTTRKTEQSQRAAGGTNPAAAGRAFAAPMTQSLPRTVQSTQPQQHTVPHSALTSPVVVTKTSGESAQAQHNFVAAPVPQDELTPIVPPNAASPLMNIDLTAVENPTDHGASTNPTP